MSAPGDTPANQPYQGIISPEGLATIASVSFWPWDGSSRGGTAQLRVQDAEGALDVLALSSARDVPVAVRQVVQGQPLSSASPVSRYVLDASISRVMEAKRWCCAMHTKISMAR